MEINFKKYAELIVKIGLNISKGDILVINSPVESYEFTRIVVESGYSAGAKEVVVHWSDEIVKRDKFLYGTDDIFEVYPQWQVESLEYYAKQGAAFLSIYSEDPTLLKDVNQERVAKYTKLRRKEMKHVMDRFMTNQNRWTVISIPTISWAKQVFPDSSDEESIKKLWDAIFKATRVDLENPVEAWREHNEKLSIRKEFMNKMNFKKLYYKNSLGTDLELELVKEHIWAGGGDLDINGVPFMANMPTEEIFSMPMKTGVNGKVVSSKPLIYNGNVIDEFTLIFKDGKVVEFDAKEGKGSLENLLNTDIGSRYLGEVALVPYNSPISNTGILFYNTLFDENASCHLAFGEAYSSCIKDGNTMKDEEKESVGMNVSLNHEDFMIGTSDLSIVGETFNGEKIEIFKNGDWAI
ncbi:MAG: aminopeptidase [Fusobacteriaceae bacterium]|nr:aminopeptidase [Fusobacteriaceae bacterium]MBP6322534.1 aminopeptidase [Fusobacteriaceae bacterium]MBP9509819.1 aminopeptidase [Fusobacteriaceae bacterium]